MKRLRILLAVIGSVWFIPVACTSGTLLGTRVVAALDNRDALRGDRLHAQFRIAAEPGENGQAFRVVVMKDWQQAKPEYSFLMSRPSASIEDSRSRYSYRVLSTDPNEQVIELIEELKDGDNTIWSRYKATASGVTPLSSRMNYFGYVFKAGLYAFAAALLLWIAARIARKKSFGAET